MLDVGTLVLLALLDALPVAVAECVAEWVIEWLIVMVPVIVSFIVGVDIFVLGVVDIGMDIELSVAGPEAGVGRLPAPPAYAAQRFGSGDGGLKVSPLAAKAETQIPFEVVRVSMINISAPTLLHQLESNPTHQPTLAASKY